MAYVLKADEPVGESIVRVAREQVGKAIDEIEDGSLDPHDAVHQARKRCKKLRGLLRLARAGLGDAYQPENGRLRDAAGGLSYVRDAQSQVVCLDALTAHFAAELRPGFAATARDRLLEHRRAVADDRAGLEARLAVLRDTLQDTYRAAGGWTIAGDGFSMLAPGLRKTYQRGRKALRRAYRQPGTESFHQWRKRVKNHGYHLRLLNQAWPAVIKAQQRELGALGDLLGDEHDLAVLRQTVAGTPDEFGTATQVEALLGLIARRREELRRHARPLGDRLFAEDAQALVRRFGDIWSAWEQERTGELPRPLVRVAAT